MISASHNSFEYNGIKIFSGDGYKLPDDLEERIEDIILGKTTFPMNFPQRPVLEPLPVQKCGAGLY